MDFADYMDRVDNITVLLNGQPTPYAEFTYYVFGNGQTNWGVGVRLDRVPNGTYQMGLQCALRISDEIDGANEACLLLTNLAKPIVVNNQVTYANWNDSILSTNYTFRAQLQNHNTDWEIDIYDASDNYVKSGYGHTSNGQISWTWDLTDSQGNSRDQLESDPFFTSSATFYDTAARLTTRPNPTFDAEFPSVGNWLISYLDHWYSDAGSKYVGGDAYYQAAMNLLYGGPALKQDPVVKFPIRFGTNSYTQADRNWTWASLFLALMNPAYRNFYYYGHAGTNLIGADMHVLDTNGYIKSGVFLPNSHAYLTTQLVHDGVTFSQRTGICRYRFVFLDGCNTANGNWPDTFGIGKTAYSDTTWYTGTNNTSHIRPGAFVGWNQVVGGQGWGTL